MRDTPINLHLQFNFDLLNEVVLQFVVDNIDQMRSGFHTLATIDLVDKLEDAGFTIVHTSELKT